MTCSVDGCDGVVRCKGLCRLHYNRMIAYGRLELLPRSEHCTSSDCTEQVVGHGLCERHYRAMRRKSGPPCTIDGCNRPRRAKGWCELHLSRWKYHGSPHWQPEYTYTYTGWHNHLNRTLGRASQKPCVDCESPAHEWSYDHSDPAPLIEQAANGPRAYSTDASRYAPRCRSCHRRMDVGRLAEALETSDLDGMMTA